MLVLDANILMRAVLGKHARALLAKYGERIKFVAPDIAFDEARRRLPQVIERRKLQEELFMAFFDSLANVVQTVEFDSSSTVGDASWPQLVDSKQGDACQREILVSRLICK